MTLPDYVWMVHNWYHNNWWKVGVEFNCTSDEIRTVLNLQIILGNYPQINEDDKNKINIGGIVS